MEFNEKLARMSSKVVQTPGDFTYYIREETEHVSCLELPTPENPTPEPQREGYYESRIYPGMFFHKYQLDVELNGQAGLTPTQFAILSILDDEGGEVKIERVLQQCKGKEMNKGNLLSHLTELNKRLDNIGVNKNASVSGPMLLFQ